MTIWSRSACLVGMVVCLSCSQANEEPLEAKAADAPTLACRAYADILRDVRAGRVTPSELQVRFRTEVYGPARAIPETSAPELKRHAVALEAAYAAADTEQAWAEARLFQEACSGSHGH